MKVALFIFTLLVGVVAGGKKKGQAKKAKEELGAGFEALASIPAPTKGAAKKGAVKKCIAKYQNDDERLEITLGSLERSLPLRMRRCGRIPRLLEFSSLAPFRSLSTNSAG